MGQSLFELSQGFNNVFELCLDESIPVDDLEAALQTIEADIDTKVSNGIGLLQTMKHQAEAMKAEADRITANRKVLENKMKWIKEYYQVSLDSMGKNKVITSRGTMSIQKNPPSYKWNEAKLPEKYFTVVPQHLEVNADAVREDLKKGVKVKGAWVEQGRSLRIR